MVKEGYARCRIKTSRGVNHTTNQSAALESWKTWATEELGGSEDAIHASINGAFLAIQKGADLEAAKKAARQAHATFSTSSASPPPSDRAYWQSWARGAYKDVTQSEIATDVAVYMAHRAASVPMAVSAAHAAVIAFCKYRPSPPTSQSHPPQPLGAKDPNPQRSSLVLLFLAIVFYSLSLIFLLNILITGLKPWSPVAVIGTFGLGLAMMRWRRMLR